MEIVLLLLLNAVKVPLKVLNVCGYLPSTLHLHLRWCEEQVLNNDLMVFFSKLLLKAHAETL